MPSQIKQGRLVKFEPSLNVNGLIGLGSWKYEATTAALLSTPTFVYRQCDANV